MQTISLHDLPHVNHVNFDETWYKPKHLTYMKKWLLKPGSLRVGRLRRTGGSCDGWQWPAGPCPALAQARCCGGRATGTVTGILVASGPRSRS